MRDEPRTHTFGPSTGLTHLGPSTACPCTEHRVADFGKYMMSMTRCYWLFTEQFTARGNDAENVQLPDLFLMKSKAAAQSPWSMTWGSDWAGGVGVGVGVVVGGWTKSWHGQDKVSTIKDSLSPK